MKFGGGQPSPAKGGMKFGQASNPATSSTTSTSTPPNTPTPTGNPPQIQPPPPVAPTPGQHMAPTDVNANSIPGAFADTRTAGYPGRPTSSTGRM
jgi:hypothetical protein